MTVERAAELVAMLSGDAKVDLFVHFDDYFNLSADKTGERITMFAELCGFLIAHNARLHSEG